MKLLKSARFLSAPSILATMALASSSASAAFIYHDTASSTGGVFNVSFPLSNLKNAGHTSAADTEDATIGSQSYATTNPPAGGGFPVTITLGFTSPVSLDEFYLWNHTNSSGAGAPANGVGDFTLTFLDATNTLIGSAFNGTALAVPAAGLNPAQVFNFGSTYEDVSTVVFTVRTKVGGVTSGFVAAREIGFNQVPEPSTALLGGLGLLALIRRRR